MYTRHICVSANEKIADISAKNGELGMMLGEFAEVCEADGRKAVSAAEKNGKKYTLVDNEILKTLVDKDTTALF